MDVNQERALRAGQHEARLRDSRANNGQSGSRRVPHQRTLAG